MTKHDGGCGFGLLIIALFSLGYLAVGAVILACVAKAVARRVNGELLGEESEWVRDEADMLVAAIKQHPKVPS